jgi:hypothetical protein
LSAYKLKLDMKLREIEELKATQSQSGTFEEGLEGI